MRRAIVMVATLSIVVAAVLPAGGHAKHPDQCSPQCQADLEKAREATVRYQLEANALADGYVPVPPCEENKHGHAMGIHYFNRGRWGDRQIELHEPEILLYVPGPMGPRLVGIEYGIGIMVEGKPYFGDAPPPKDAEPSRPPVLFRHEFDGPMPGHVRLQEWHYDLHVWAWAENPDGVFAHYNPDVSCVSAA